MEAAVAASPGAVISNQASLDYSNRSGQAVRVLSNEVSVVTAVVRSPSVIEFMRVVNAGAGAFREPVGPAACLQNGAFTALPDPVLSGGTVIDPGESHDTNTTNAYNSGNTAFIRLRDSDQNLDYQVVDRVVVTVNSSETGDTETVELSETGVNTGVFAGYIPLASGAAMPGDCALQTAPRSAITTRYTDPADANDTAESAAEIDPVARVFESRTGTVVSGSTIEIVYASTGLPATVYGNDGVSLFPSSLVSGATVTDSSGTVYAFGPGEYRFPVVPDGEYRLVVSPPDAYGAPSSALIDDLQSLPGAPYDLGPASFGDTFTKSDGSSIAIDIPLDPLSSSLFLKKTTVTAFAAPGDFVRYELSLENTSETDVANAVTIVDQLPGGLRYVAGSTTLDGAVAPDPLILADSNTLQFSIAELAIAGSSRISYVTEIVSGERDDDIVNTASAFAAGGLISNDASAVIRLTEDLFRSTATIIGRIVEADCGQETFGEEQGVADIRVYLEDGRYAVTDAGGRFHFEGLSPGAHVAQLDTFTIPDYLDVIGCADTPGFAGAAASQFVRLSRGSMHRADFFLQRKAPPQGRIDIEMRNFGTESAELVAYALQLNGVGNVEVDNIELFIELPAGVTYKPGTFKLNGESLAEPRLEGSLITLSLNPQFGNWNSSLDFVAEIEDSVDGELVTRAYANFDTPMQQQQRTPLVETKMVREPALIENDGYVLDLKFAVLSDELSPQDKLQLEQLIASWKGVRNIRLSAVGHSDGQRISASESSHFRRQLRAVARTCPCRRCVYRHRVADRAQANPGRGSRSGRPCGRQRVGRRSAEKPPRRDCHERHQTQATFVPGSDPGIQWHQADLDRRRDPGS